jgi:hypothetical protein
MNIDIFAKAMSEAFDRAITASVQAHMAGIFQNYADSYTQFSADIDSLKQQVAALELRIPVEGMTEVRVGELIDEAVEKAMDAHTSGYDHDAYDSVVEDFDADRLVDKDDLEEEIRSVLRNITVSLDV